MCLIHNPVIKLALSNYNGFILINQPGLQLYTHLFGSRVHYAKEGLILKQ